jgi:hypothetical protein
MEENKIDWQRCHVSIPHSGWCGPATIKIILNAAGIKKSIYEIAAHVWKWWYGSSFILVVAYLKKYFSLVNYRTGASIGDIKKHLSLGHVCIINFQSEGEGHYALVVSHDGKFLTIVDASNETDWSYVMTTGELKRVWFDTLTNDDSLWHENLLIWCDLKSKRSK